MRSVIAPTGYTSVSVSVSFNFVALQRRIEGRGRELGAFGRHLGLYYSLVRNRRRQLLSDEQRCCGFRVGGVGLTSRQRPDSLPLRFVERVTPAFCGDAEES